MTQDAHTAHTAHSLAGAYALDALSEHERRQFEAHMTECESCGQEVRGLQETAARLAIATAQLPPPGLRERVLAEAVHVRQLPPRLSGAQPAGRRWFPRLMLVAAAASVAVALAMGVSLVRTQDRLDRVQAMNAVLTAADAQTVTQPVSTGGRGTVVASRRQGRAVVMMAGLPSLPPSKTYELWLMRPGEVRPAGLLNASLPPTLLDIGDAADIGLTVEPAGGSRQPTTTPIFQAPIPA